MINDTLMIAVSNDVLSDDVLGVISGGEINCKYTHFSICGYMDISISKCTQTTDLVDNWVVGM